MSVIVLNLVVSGGTPPSEFCIFAPDKNGRVQTSKGSFIFDAAAAESVLSEYQTHGIDLMIDYDHASLGSSRAPDPAQAGKAAGWFNLELRGGALYATNVRWTLQAAAALERKEWRFMSPAFEVSEERIVSLLNVALVNMPATRKLQPLMAAAKGTKMAEGNTKSGMTLDELLKVAKALGLDPAATSVQDIMAKLMSGASPGDPDAATEDAPPPAGDGGSDEVTESAAPHAQDPQAPAPDDQKKKDQAAMSGLAELTGKANVSDAVEEISAWRTSHLELEAERRKLSADRATLESAERRRLCVELIKLGAEFPATVWADDKAAALKPRWTKMPLAELRAHTAEQRTARGVKVAPTPPTKKIEVSPEHAALGLTDRELAICKETGCDPVVFASLKAPSAGV